MFNEARKERILRASFKAGVLFYRVIPSRWESDFPGILLSIIYYI